MHHAAWDEWAPRATRHLRQAVSWSTAITQGFRGAFLALGSGPAQAACDGGGGAGVPWQLAAAHADDRLAQILVMILSVDPWR